MVHCACIYRIYVSIVYRYIDIGNIFLYYTAPCVELYPSGGWAVANHRHKPTFEDVSHVAGCCDQFCGTAAREFTLGVAGAGKNWDPINLEFPTSHDRFHPKKVANRERNTIISGTSRFVIFSCDLALISLLLGGWVPPRTCFGDTCFCQPWWVVSALRIGVGSLPNGQYKWHRRTYMGLILTTEPSPGMILHVVFFSDSWTVLKQKLSKQITEISTMVTPKCAWSSSRNSWE